jgi:peptide/nickel transport system permease protein
MNYYIQKAAGLLVTLLLVSFITFSVFQILPGNPAYIILGVDADPMQIEALNKSMGLDKPALVRYVDWIAGLFRGDLGVSYRYQQPVAQLISDALEVTGSLAIITLILTLIIGVLAGVWLADHSDKWYSLPLSMLSVFLYGNLFNQHFYSWFKMASIYWFCIIFRKPVRMA